MNLCPCCGSRTASELLVDLDTNQIAYKGQFIRVPAKCTELAYVLSQRYPRTVSFDALIAKIWGATSHEPTDARNALRIYASILRRSLAMIDMDIIAIRNVGYRLSHKWKEVEYVD